MADPSIIFPSVEEPFVSSPTRVSEARLRRAVENKRISRQQSSQRKEKPSHASGSSRPPQLPKVRPRHGTARCSKASSPEKQSSSDESHTNTKHSIRNSQQQETSSRSCSTVKEVSSATKYSYQFGGERELQRQERIREAAQKAEQRRLEDEKR